MSIENDDVQYIGPADFHDAIITTVELEKDRVRVEIRGASGQMYAAEFTEVVDVTAVRPQGMMLYALSELASVRGARRFMFTNWDHESDARLEIVAGDLQISTFSPGREAPP